MKEERQVGEDGNSVSLKLLISLGRDNYYLMILATGCIGDF
jgi:hypothetical protein